MSLSDKLIEALFLLDRYNLSSTPLCAVDRDSCVYVSGALCEALGLSGSPSYPIPVTDLFPNYREIDVSRGWVETAMRGPGGGLRLERVLVAEVGDDLRLIRVQQQPGAGDYLRSFHAQRLETLGMLAGGIAHDFNNVLTGILGHVTYLKTILPAVGPHVESLGALEEGASKASQMTQQILNFSRMESTEDDRCLDLGEIVRKTSKLLRGAISPEFNLSLDVAKLPILIEGAEGKMAQVLVNLVVNARDALSSDGTISVHLDHASGAPPFTYAIERAPAGWAVLTVSDDGVGIPDHVLPRIFEPYFTTKFDKGTGLGLSTVRQIVRDARGEVVVVSSEGEGTSIRVWLPISPSVAPPVHSSGHRGALAGGEERVLIIDDDSPVRHVVAVSLQHLGYRVEAAGSGTEALDRYRSEGPFDLVILDMLMPQQSGVQVFFKLKELDPAVRVMVMSGYSSEESVQRILQNGGLDFVQKPFTIEVLSQKVRACLDRREKPESKMAEPQLASGAASKPV